MKFNPKISHEFPEPLLKMGSSMTDYDYALAHLFETNEKYRNHFIKMKDQGREIILDNSLFEKGVAYRGEQFADQIRMLKPSYYVVPDVFDDYEANIKSAKKFLEGHSFRHSSPLVVVQGANFWELLTGYVQIRSLVKDEKDYMIAFPFGSKAFLDVNSDAMRGLQKYEEQEYLKNSTYRRARNRFYFMEMLSRLDILKGASIHLLGNYAPVEFLYYRDSPFDFSMIKSLDTSHPVATGLEGMSYIDTGIYYKPKVKIDPSYHNPVSDKVSELVVKNIDHFRNMCGKENLY